MCPYDIVRQSAGVFLKRRVCVYRAVQEKAFTYALQTHYPTQREENGMASLQARGLRRAQHVPAAYFSRVSYFELLADAEATPLQVCWRYERLRLYGH